VETQICIALEHLPSPPYWVTFQRGETSLSPQGMHHLWVKETSELVNYHPRSATDLLPTWGTIKEIFIKYIHFKYHFETFKKQFPIFG
jgi:hypothetical protein